MVKNYIRKGNHGSGGRNSMLHLPGSDRYGTSFHVCGVHFDPAAVASSTSRSALQLPLSLRHALDCQPPAQPRRITSALQTEAECVRGRPLAAASRGASSLMVRRRFDSEMRVNPSPSRRDSPKKRTTVQYNYVALVLLCFQAEAQNCHRESPGQL